MAGELDSSSFVFGGKIINSVQRLKSILDGAPGWWVMRLYQGLGSSGGGTGILDIAGASSAQQVGVVAMRTNRTPRNLSVIFFFKVLFVKGDVLCPSMFPSGPS